VIKQIVVYIEGGVSKTADIEFRAAFRTFFKEIDSKASEKGIGFRVILEGTRRKAYEKFCEAIDRQDDTYPVLLVDSEAAVAEFGTCWKHLKERVGDEWDQPAKAEDRHCHLMVEAMEAWFFADPEALEKYYGQNFIRNSLPKTANVETIPKKDHIAKLEAATKNTQKKRYHKVHHAPEILKRLDPVKVRKRAPHCDRIFTTLVRVINEQS
jgi:hypothetical protein